jgi:hypothetical protein
MAPDLSDIDPLGMGGSQIQKFKGNQMIVKDNVGTTKNIGSFLGQKAGVSWPGTHQIDFWQVVLKVPGPIIVRHS